MARVIRGFDKPIDWMKVAAHVLASKYVVTRRRLPAMVKFDGGRDNGRVYTIRVDGRVGCDGFIEESGDLEGAVSRAFPGGDDVLKPGTAELARMLSTLHAWASQGNVVVISTLWRGDALGYSAHVFGRDRRSVSVEGQSIVDVVAQSITEFEALLSRSE